MTISDQSWIEQILGGSLPRHGEKVVRNGRTLAMLDGIVRDIELKGPEDQQQVRDTFDFKWHQEQTYASDAMRNAQRAWLQERFGAIGKPLALLKGTVDSPIVLDAGCGAGFSASIMLERDLPRIRYVGVDISTAVDLAARRLRPLARQSLFVQADILNLPFCNGAFDVAISEGVLHHIPSTQNGIRALVSAVKPGGLVVFYVYNRKAPIREFTDDYVREQLSNLSPQQAWNELLSLTRLGQALGELNMEINVPEDVNLLGIPSGHINIQRLFYWYIFKAYYRPEFDLQEMNHINFDWFTPKYCHRQTPGEVRGWCETENLHIEHMYVENAGITVVGRVCE